METVRKILGVITHRVFILSFVVVLEIVLVLILVLKMNFQYFGHLYIISYLLGILLSIFIINGKANPGYKIAWIMVMLILPIVGPVIYLMLGGDQLSRREKNKLKEIYSHQLRNIEHDDKIMEKLKEENIYAYNQAKYITNYSLSPVCQKTECTYFKVGEEYYKRLLTELKKAEKYIFLEYFIIEQGVMWDSILEVLKEKVKEGVEVRVMYDDFGCIMLLPNKYFKTLEKYGIKSCSFNRIVPILKSKFNNRDHRKIVIIDGYIAFTGGINLADEYINEKEKYGHWKDNGVMLKGKATWNMAVMFMTLWDFVKGENYSYRLYLPDSSKVKNIKTDGYVIPYCDNPWDHEATGETIYLNLINKATKSICITTPYLIMDNEMVTALCVAAKNGIDIKIITPYIPDKKLINEVTKAYYSQLMECGIRIFEYTPGFIHAKTFIIDDEYATVGTVNLDYRSLYLNFENGVWLYKSKAIEDIKKDFEETLDKSEEIKLDVQVKLTRLQNLKRQILVAFAPLM